MARDPNRASRLQRSLPLLTIIASAGLVTAFTGHPADSTDQEVSAEEVLRGRQLVLEHACGACHGGGYAPDAEGWLIGLVEDRPQTGPFPIGACASEPGAEPCFLTRPRNLTPDNLTGLGRFTERQIFNGLRFGLRPGETPDVEITSSTPGEGNFPKNPKYLAPPMPWMAWRHMPDDDLWAIAAYLEHGVKPVRHRVPDSDGPPDFWASGMTPENIGPYPAAAFPTAHEVRPTDPTVDMDQVLRGRQVVIQHDCGACHGGPSPLSEGWLAGVGAVPRTVEFPIGPCIYEAGAQPCWMQRARNLTPHETTGTGRYTDRQLFNALRYGLRPSATPDVEIESDTPGQGHFPVEPDYLGLGMPWPAWRYMSDEDLWAVVAYLKHAVRPVDNEVPESDAPPDLWASEYTVEKIGPYPAPPYPTANEVAR
jgi:mono/diheme cytochrome c family protein